MKKEGLPDQKIRQIPREHKRGELRQKKLGRCESYLQNLKLSITHSLTHRRRKVGEVGEAGKVGEVGEVGEVGR